MNYEKRERNMSASLCRWDLTFGLFIFPLTCEISVLEKRSHGNQVEIKEETEKRRRSIVYKLK